VANTVVRTDTLWLTSLSRQGNALTILGTAGSINAVANFITQLEHSGYFNQIEIKESVQDSKNAAIQTFTFTLTAQFALPQEKSAASISAPAGKG
jgi:Tfp pilus assembly protein PilN